MAAGPWARWQSLRACLGPGSWGPSPAERVRSGSTHEGTVPSFQLRGAAQRLLLQGRAAAPGSQEAQKSSSPCPSVCTRSERLPHSSSLSLHCPLGQVSPRGACHAVRLGPKGCVMVIIRPRAVCHRSVHSPHFPDTRHLLAPPDWGSAVISAEVARGPCAGRGEGLGFAAGPMALLSARSTRAACICGWSFRYW